MAVLYSTHAEAMPVRRPYMTRIAGLALGMVLGLSPGVALAADDPWPGLQADAFASRPMTADSGVVALEAPYRAEDAAIVPMTITLKADAAAKPVRKITLVIDRNPAPISAVFTLGEIGHQPDLHPVSGELLHQGPRCRRDKRRQAACRREIRQSLGRLLGAGGQGPGRGQGQYGKDEARQFATPDGRREAQLMLRHPNHSGFQMDQITHYYTPAMFIRELTIRQGDDLLSASGGISLSEDPNIRFDYTPNGADKFTVEAVDTDEHRFKGVSRRNHQPIGLRR